MSSGELVAIPSENFRSVELLRNTVVASHRSGFSLASQQFDWQAEAWEAEIALPPLPHDLAQDWSAAISMLRGPLNYFAMGDPFRKRRGVPLGSPVASSPVERSRTINTTGWTPDRPNLLLPGDLFQIGDRLYESQTLVGSDGVGAATIKVFPQLGAHSGGDPLVTVSPVGLWRLTEPIPISATHLRLWGLSFRAVQRIP